MIRLLIAEDQALVREGLCALLGCYDDLAVVAQMADGRAAVQALADGLEIDVLLLDVRMPQGGALYTLGELRMRNLERPALLLTTFDDSAALQAGIALGARGCLLKDVPVEELVEAIRLIAAGGSIAYRPVALLPLVLTEREQSVLRELREGKQNKEIAASLGLSPGTVRNYISTLFEKLGVRDRAQAIRRLQELGL
ncbi:MAG: two-component system regulatory protein [Moraxellaceae bacterium]|jgi:DNA-binding NarL/FixJ family response regulator|nr:two-component system regulatory protein [Moraxellaceae bacterium]